MCKREVVGSALGWEGGCRECFVCKREVVGSALCVRGRLYGVLCV